MDCWLYAFWIIHLHVWHLFSSLKCICTPQNIFDTWKEHSRNPLYQDSVTRVNIRHRDSNIPLTPTPLLRRRAPASSSQRSPSPFSTCNIIAQKAGKFADVLFVHIKQTGIYVWHKRGLENPRFHFVVLLSPRDIYRIGPSLFFKVFCWTFEMVLLPENDIKMRIVESFLFSRCLFFSRITFLPISLKICYLTRFQSCFLSKRSLYVRLKTWCTLWVCWLFQEHKDTVWARKRKSEFDPMRIKYIAHNLLEKAY